MAKKQAGHFEKVPVIRE
jgi:hypothetical protein